MSNIPRQQEPGALDISHLDIGPPLDAGPERDGARSLVVVPPVPARRDDDNRANESPRARKRLPPPDQTQTRLPDGRMSDVRRMTPREMQSYSELLYAAGIVGFEDYEAMAFQPDLHPSFTRTIGALTGEAPAPDRPRNFIRFWQERLIFAKRYWPADAPEVRQARRILEALTAYPREADALA